MKKIVLFAAALTLCAGLTFAQNPVKKNSQEKPKTETKATLNNGKEAPQGATKDNCGKCPHHKECKAQAKPEAKPANNANTATTKEKKANKVENQQAIKK